MSVTATYVSANTFKVEDQNAVALFPETSRVKINCNGTWVASHVISVSYDGTDTTVELYASVLTDPCGETIPGEITSGALGNLPPHEHDSADNGGTGVVGSPPAHQWSGTSLQFMTPEGTWGSLVNLIGATGATGSSITAQGDWALSEVYNAGDILNHNRVTYVVKAGQGHTSDSTSEPGIGVYWETYWQILFSTNVDIMEVAFLAASMVDISSIYDLTGESS